MGIVNRKGDGGSNLGLPSQGVRLLQRQGGQVPIHKQTTKTLQSYTSQFVLPTVLKTHQPHPSLQGVKVPT